MRAENAGAGEIPRACMFISLIFVSASQPGGIFIITLVLKLGKSDNEEMLHSKVRRLSKEMCTSASEF